MGCITFIPPDTEIYNTASGVMKLMSGLAHHAFLPVYHAELNYKYSLLNENYSSASPSLIRLALMIIGMIIV